MQLIPVDISKRTFGLDVLRTIAILVVVYEHGNFIIENTLPNLAGLKVFDGVDLFFVLSGFLIGSIILNDLSRPDWFKIKRFYIRRWFRTLPNYFLFLLINILLIGLGLANGTLNKYLISFFVFLQNFFVPFDFLYWESWSLSIEEWFYFLFPLLLLLIWLFIRGIKHAFFISVLIFISSSLILRLVLFSDKALAYWEWDLFIRKQTPYHFDVIGFGLMMAWLKHFYHQKFYAIKWISLLVGMTLISINLLIHYDNFQSYYNTFFVFVNGLGFSLLLPAFDNWKSIPKHFGRIVVFISLISYSMYLVNLGIVGSLIKQNVNYFEYNVSIIWYFLYWIFVIVISWINFRFFEWPITQFRERYS